jgi:hypothetical protein
MCVCVSGLANYCVPAGEAYQKALDIACEITQKVRIILNLIFQRQEFLHEFSFPSKIDMPQYIFATKKFKHKCK